jgi:hypothetical protein
LAVGAVEPVFVSRQRKWGSAEFLRPEPGPPDPHSLEANLDPAVEWQVFNVPQAERELHIHHHNQADDIG